MKFLPSGPPCQTWRSSRVRPSPSMHELKLRILACTEGVVDEFMEATPPLSEKQTSYLQRPTQKVIPDSRSAFCHIKN